MGEPVGSWLLHGGKKSNVDGDWDYNRYKMPQLITSDEASHQKNTLFEKSYPCSLPYKHIKNKVIASSKDLNDLLFEIAIFAF